MAGVHPRVLGYLGRALSLEFTAVQQYMTQASLLALWGDSVAAERMRREMVEEIQHAEQLIQQMLLLGVIPSASQLRPVRSAGDLIGLLNQDAELEAEQIQHYAEASRFCTLIGDAANASFFQTLWEEETQLGQDLERWLQELRGGHWATINQRATF